MRLWGDALNLAKVRNRVAHNPIVFAWNSPAEAGEPDFIGIPSLRNSGAASRDSLLSKAAADKATNQMAALAQSLRDLRLEWSSARDNGRVPPQPEALTSRSMFARLLEKVVNLARRLMGRA